ncbi:MAG: hypothetical protein ABW051_10935 [Burkholderiaceae bacterium]
MSASKALVATVFAALLVACDKPASPPSSGSPPPASPPAATSPAPSTAPVSSAPNPSGPSDGGTAIGGVVGNQEKGGASSGKPAPTGGDGAAPK